MDCGDLEEMEAGMTTHTLKIDSEHLFYVKKGEKRTEIRKNDRNYAVGDILGLFAKDDPIGAYVEVTHILTHDDFPEGIKEGYVALSIDTGKEVQEIVRLKARVAELEQTNVFWLPGIESSPPSALPDCLELVSTQAALLTPIEMHGARKLRSWWYVLKRIDGENEEATLFATKEKAEAFCQKMRAEKGEGA